MTGTNDSSRPSDAALIGRYLDGTLDGAERAVFQERVRSSADFRRRVVDESAVHAALRDQQTWVEADRVKKGVSGSPLLRTAAMFVGLVAVATICLLVLVNRDGPSDRGSSQATIGALATVVSSSDPEFVIGQVLGAGKLRLEEGFAEIQMIAGARLALDAGTETYLVASDRIRLLSGSIGADVPKGAEGFTVETPSGKIVDLGTRFGVSVADDGKTRAELFQGEFEVYAGDKDPRRYKGSAAVTIGRSGDINEPSENQVTPSEFPMPLLVETIEIIRGEFDQGPFHVGDPAPGIWGGDVAEIVGRENGISPHSGQGMLRLVSSSKYRGPSANTSCNIRQWVDLQDQLFGAAGIEGIRVEAVCHANRIAGSPRIDTQFRLNTEAFKEMPVSTEDMLASRLLQREVSLLSDDDPTTWEQLELSTAIPSGSRFLLIEVGSIENIQDAIDGDQPEFEGHYMDSVEMRIIIPARPSVR